MLAHSTSQWYFALQGLHKARPITTLCYRACAKQVPVLLCTTQSLHKARPSTTFYSKTCTKRVPVLLCTTRYLYYEACKLFCHVSVLLCHVKSHTALHCSVLLRYVKSHTTLHCSVLLCRVKSHTTLPWSVMSCHVKSHLQHCMWEQVLSFLYIEEIDKHHRKSWQRHEQIFETTEKPKQAIKTSMKTIQTSM